MRSISESMKQYRLHIEPDHVDKGFVVASAATS